MSVALESTDLTVQQFGSIVTGLTGKSMAIARMEPTDPSGVFSHATPDCIEAFATRPSETLGCSRTIPGIGEGDIKEDVSLLDLDEADS